MKMHRLYQEQTVDLGIDEAWNFFSRPQNLDALTPPDMQFRITSEAVPETFEGQIITYRIRLAPMIWQTWVTEIKAVDPGRSFIDEQRFGPYKFWHHRHELIPEGDRTRVVDEVNYALGFGPFGAIAHQLYVSKKLKSVFDYRRRVLNEKFNQATGAQATPADSTQASPVPLGAAG